MVSNRSNLPLIVSLVLPGVVFGCSFPAEGCGWSSKYKKKTKQNVKIKMLNYILYIYIYIYIYEYNELPFSISKTSL